ncbi:MAG TPA: YARHG domain-containing protein, partial [Blastocatellia bacterium]|nr:YARHG domain-containing protein [Blastocatellia bacterium]
VIMRALAKAPGERQADAGEFASDLARAVSGQATRPVAQAETARGSGMPPPTRQASLSEMGLGAAAPGVLQAKKSNTGLIAGAAIGVVVLLIGAGAGFWLLSNGDTNTQGGPSNQNSSSQVLAQTQPASSDAANTNQVRQPSASVADTGRNVATPPPPVAQPANPTPLPSPPAASNPAPGPPPAPAGADQPGRASAEAIARQAENKILANQRLTESDLEGLPIGRLRMLRNTVYARHGRPFQVPAVRLYFQARDWYTPRPGYRDSDLTPVDRANVRTIMMAENRAR